VTPTHDLGHHTALQRNNSYFANLIKRLLGNFVPLLITCQDHVLDYPAHADLKAFKFRRRRPLRVSVRAEKYYFSLRGSGGQLRCRTRLTTRY
jgi:hypothetical protein